ncbi:septum formation protein Maf [Aliifodinibius salipaludis]|uniref:dTTP/UTP pyrophosphatase n=1 Tax=Fodinibius salipaludis TaxID=2032627 RepID=A0A2A2GDV4_9BACT|nr:Maf family protein [Aliifodinibius salipaludis]PAU95711.1 septum formation protein Maf [Aliifodinibius salipaludis]
METIILASGSPRRKELLQKIGITFKVHASKVNEDYESHWSPNQIAETLAERKARDIAPKYGNALIIGADTIVTHNGKILEKPATPSEANTMLRQLSGHSHKVLTGVSLLKTDASNNITDHRTFVETTNVIFGELNPTLVNAYVATTNPMDKAGAYGIQDPHGTLFVEAIEGDYYNVVGFPLHRFYNILTSFAPKLLSQQNLYQYSDDS